MFEIIKDKLYINRNRSSMQSFRGLMSNGDCYASKRPRLDDHDELLKIRQQVGVFRFHDQVYPYQIDTTNRQ
jgi:hypothetical protein